jgi:aminopeptidase S
VIQELGTAANDAAAWTTQSVDISAFAGQSIRIVITAADNAGGSLVEAGVDDVVITRR